MREVYMEVPEEIQNKYLQRRQKDLEVCLKSLETGNFQGLEKVGHQLKGNATTFGYPELSSIGEQLEDGASFRDSIKIREALQEFSNWLRKKLN
jgi:HPt (histidine-containing phosphotransfer) domain-containing protein